MTNKNTLEGLLEQLEPPIEQLIKLTSALAAKSKKVKKLVEVGNLKDLKPATEELISLLNSITIFVNEFSDDAEFDLKDYLQSGLYAAELLEVAKAKQLLLNIDNESLQCYPSIIQILPNDEAVLIDKVKSKSLRPSQLINSLKLKSGLTVKFRGEPFIEALKNAYDYVISNKKANQGSIVKLSDIYRVLTILPASKSYSKTEFSRDLYLLEMNKITTTKSNHHMKLHSSASSKSGTIFQTVTKGGQILTYASISFGDKND